MIAKTYTCSLLGIDALLVEVEADLSSGLPGFSIVMPYLTRLTPQLPGNSGFHGSARRGRFMEDLGPTGMQLIGSSGHSLPGSDSRAYKMKMEAESRCRVNGSCNLRKTIYFCLPYCTLVLVEPRLTRSLSKIRPCPKFCGIIRGSYFGVLGRTREDQYESSS